MGELLVGGGHPVVHTQDVLDGDADRLTGGPQRRAGVEATEADLGALQIGEDADGATGGVRGRPHALVVGFVVAVLTVTEVQPRDIHARFDESLDQFITANSRSESTYDFAASSHDESA